MNALVRRLPITALLIQSSRQQNPSCGERAALEGRHGQFGAVVVVVNGKKHLMSIDLPARRGVSLVTVLASDDHQGCSFVVGSGLSPYKELTVLYEKRWSIRTAQNQDAGTTTYSIQQRCDVQSWTHSGNHV